MAEVAILRLRTTPFIQVSPRSKARSLSSTLADPGLADGGWVAERVVRQTGTFPPRDAAMFRFPFRRGHPDACPFVPSTELATRRGAADRCDPGARQAHTPSKHTRRSRLRRVAGFPAPKGEPRT